IATDRIRVLANSGGASGDYSRIVELEAWTIVSYQIAGTVTVGGAAFAGGAVGAGAGTSCTASGAQGAYSCTVPAGWSGSVTPSLTGYTFSPGSTSYTAVVANQSAQDFVGAIAPVTIAGTVSAGGAPLAGVVISPSGGATCTNSDAAGHYSCTAIRGWS